MADGTAIEWTDATWNIITGCQVVSPGCTNCYAMRLSGTRLKHHPSRAGLTRDSKAGPVWTGEVRLNGDWLTQPLKWRDPRKIFVCAHGDLFADGVKTWWLDDIFGVMALCPQHVFQVLTKRPQRAAEYLSGIGRSAHPQDMARRSIESTIRPGRRQVMLPWPLPNVWVGTSVEDQLRAEERIPALLDAQAAVHWISAEPLLGPINLRRLADRHFPGTFLDGLTGRYFKASGEPTTRPDKKKGLALVIGGGESGPHARVTPWGAFAALRDQCATTGTAYFHKQNGAWVWAPDGLNFEEADQWVRDTYPKVKDIRIEHHSDGRTAALVGKKLAGRLLDGVEWNQMPTGASS